MSFDATAAVVVKDLSKAYRIFRRPSDRIRQSVLRHRKYYQEFWALKSVSFTVKMGETVGIIGRNGSGKSTLLQLIAGTLTPSTGEVWVSGSVAALLELGSGFNPEFTGRENVFLNGAILGLGREEVEDRLDEIVRFAELEAFIEQPVRTYSSGMVIRLAFAVQAILSRDILIIDEALAVGDEAFQRKSFGKIREFGDKGGTILLVSHAPGIVAELCDRALLLDSGELLAEGPSHVVVNHYKRFVYATPSTQTKLREQLRTDLGKAAEADGHTATTGRFEIDFGAQETDDQSEAATATYDASLKAEHPIRYPSRGARIEEVSIVNGEGNRVNVLRSKERYVWRYRVVFERAAKNVRFGMMVKTITGYELGGAVTASPGRGLDVVDAGSSVDVEFPFRAMLAPGNYSVNAGVLGTTHEGEVFLDRRIDAEVFKVFLDADAPVTGNVDFDVRPRVVVHESSRP